MARPPPARSKGRSWRPGKGATWVPAGLSPPPSRKGVPPPASSNRPARRCSAPVNAPFSWPNSLKRWGVPAAQIVELDWWQSRAFGDLVLWATPARHASGRTLIFDDGATLWAGYAFLGARHRVYYSGDTGLSPALRQVGERLGPFDLTMIEVGQYDRAWPDWHLGPEQAVEAHLRVRGAVLLPVHWGLFALASHGWTEPIERTIAAGRKAGAVVITPRPGQSVEPTVEQPQER